MTQAQRSARRMVLLEFLAWLAERPGGLAGLARTSATDDCLVDRFLRVQERNEDRAA